jgi:signal transduction histidine kinase
MPKVAEFPVFFWQILDKQLSLLPFFVLQMVAVMAMFMFTLVALRGLDTRRTSNQWVFGVVFGVTAYLLTALVADFIGGTLKPYIRNEILFVSALVGGWPGGLICGVLAYAARLQFTGTSLWLLSALECISYVVAGALLHPVMQRRDLLSIAPKEVLLISGVFAATGFLGPIFFHWGWPEIIKQSTYLTMWTARALRFPVMLGTLFGMLLLIKLDAQRQRYQALELQRMGSEVQGSKERELRLVMMSHSLKTPLTRLRLRTEMLDDAALKQDFDDDLHELEDMVHASLESMRGASAQEEVTATRLDVLISRLASRPIYIDAKVAFWGEPLTIWARPQAIERALGNLLDNGILYGKKVIVSLERKAQLAHITLRDFGAGIPEADQQSVFNPSVRLAGAQATNKNGTGLGLGIARDIIRAHGGDLMLRNHPEGGLEVTVRLPLRDMTSVT